MEDFFYVDRPECEAREREEKSRLLQEILAASTASDVKDLRMALAQILAEERDSRFYGSCSCAGKNSCAGHVPETTKIARAALGLPPLPDRKRVRPKEVVAQREP